MVLGRLQTLLTGFPNWDVSRVLCLRIHNSSPLNSNKLVVVSHVITMNNSIAFFLTFLIMVFLTSICREAAVTSPDWLQIWSFGCSNDINGTCKNAACKRFLTDIRYGLSSIQSVPFHKVKGVFKFLFQKKIPFWKLAIFWCANVNKYHNINN